MESLSLEARVLMEVMSQSHQPNVFETGGPSGSGGGSKVSDVAAYSADGCLIRVCFKTRVSAPQTFTLCRSAGAFNGGGRPSPRGVVVQLAGDCRGRVGPGTGRGTVGGPVGWRAQ